MITELPDDATPDEARDWLRSITRDFGLGFHPDTRPEDYIDDHGRRLSDVDIASMNVSLERVFALLGDTEPYDVCLDEARSVLIRNLTRD